ncbi:MAG: hypothetical protein LCH54_15725 [Bacteroidetes bacterium]|nr:hypothetical protein [Bacteroidota bacterium]
MENLNWMDELELEKVLTGDAKLVLDNCGPETVKQLWWKLQGIAIYPSQTAINDAMRAYMRKKFDGTNYKEIAVTLGVSERFVREVLAKNPRGLNDTFDLFQQEQQNEQSAGL